MLEEFCDIEILVAHGEEANVHNKAIELSQEFVWRRFLEEYLELLDKEGRIFIHLQKANNG